MSLFKIIFLHNRKYFLSIITILYAVYTIYNINYSFHPFLLAGYGHLSPNTPFGQVFCIIYSLFGIPLNTLVFVALAGFYSEHVSPPSDIVVFT